MANKINPRRKPATQEDVNRAWGEGVIEGIRCMREESTMGGKPLNNELYEKVVTDRLVFGKPAAQIAKEADALISNHTIDEYDCSEVISVEDIRNAPTVIEAEEGET